MGKIKKFLAWGILCIPGIICAQPVLQSELNLPRAGDEIIKQQVRYKNPGRSGNNVIWNFGQLESVNDEYSLVYSEPYLIGDSIYILGMDTIYADALEIDNRLFIGTEHYTNYYYLYRDGCLWTLGHENAANRLQYQKPLLTGKFPLQYGDKQCYSYRANGLYSRSVPFETEGNSCVETDAYGMLILPSGDTLRQVIRTKNIQTFSEILPTPTGEWVDMNTRQETYKWYSQGYRYPVFETIKTIVRRDSAETNQFKTAFFYPPQNHYYLENDVNNLIVLDSLANDAIDVWAGLLYNVFPSPVYHTLYAEIYLPKQACVRVQIRSVMGITILDENKGTYPAGMCNFQFNVGSFPVNNYILDIWLDEHLISEIILKR